MYLSNNRPAILASPKRCKGLLSYHLNGGLSEQPHGRLVSLGETSENIIFGNVGSHGLWTAESFSDALSYCHALSYYKREVHGRGNEHPPWVPSVQIGYLEISTRTHS
jgi:hypothetical protein